MGSYFNSKVKNENNCVENRSKYTNKYSRCCYNQDAVVLFRLSYLGAFVFKFTLGAVIIESAVVFASIRYATLDAFNVGQSSSNSSAN